MTFSERIADLRLAIADRTSKGLEPWVSVTCASCGQTQAIADPNLDHIEGMFPGWELGSERPYRDYCPDCRDID